jgi:hypothetical protein
MNEEIRILCHLPEPKHPRIPCHFGLTVNPVGPNNGYPSRADRHTVVQDAGEKKKPDRFPKRSLTEIHDSAGVGSLIEVCAKGGKLNHA